MKDAFDASARRYLAIWLLLTWVPWTLSFMGSFLIDEALGKATSTRIGVVPLTLCFASPLLAWSVGRASLAAHAPKGAVPLTAPAPRWAIWLFALYLLGRWWMPYLNNKGLDLISLALDVGAHLAYLALCARDLNRVAWLVVAEATYRVAGASFLRQGAVPGAHMRITYTDEAGGIIESQEVGGTRRWQIVGSARPSIRGEKE